MHKRKEGLSQLLYEPTRARDGVQEVEQLLVRHGQVQVLEARLAVIYLPAMLDPRLGKLVEVVVAAEQATGAGHELHELHKLQELVNSKLLLFYMLLQPPKSCFLTH